MKKIYLALTLLCFSAVSFAAGALLTVTPNWNNIILRSDSFAVIRYTVTNNTNVSLPNILLPDPNIPGVAIQSNFDNTCSGVTLAPSSSCNFNIILTGSTLPTNAQVRPRVCAGNGTVCSVPSAANALNLSRVTISAAYLYLPIINGSGANANKVRQLSSVTPYALANALTATPAFSFTDDKDNGGIAVSHDGQYLYILDNGRQRMVIFSTAGTPTQRGSVEIPEGTYTPDLIGIAVSPDDNTVYVTDAMNTKLYVIDVINKAMPTISGDPIPISAGAAGVAISPDSAYAYVGGSNTITKVTLADRSTDLPPYFETKPK